ncbi:hypothetical protein KSP39_PZI002312 [Platanthera zijinensis]|uniref:Uncharacterized protein n=1 Tax=Platanthera zijinensis TaxID=2320716 RepID=A0AAP0BZP2_9ASPA
MELCLVEENDTTKPSTLVGLKQTEKGLSPTTAVLSVPPGSCASPRFPFYWDTIRNIY